MPHKDLTTLRAYLAKNKDRRAASFAAWEHANRERRNAYRRTLNAKHKRVSTAEEREKANAYNRAWRAANREKNRAYHAAWREKHPEAAQRGLERLRLREYGVTPEQFAATVEAQHGVCAICEEPPKGSFHVDHDHETGQFRGLLCGKCNRGIGMFRESPALLVKARMYVEHHAKTRNSA